MLVLVQVLATTYPTSKDLAAFLHELIMHLCRRHAENPKAAAGGGTGAGRGDGGWVAYRRSYVSFVASQPMRRPQWRVRLPLRPLSRRRKAGSRLVATTKDSESLRHPFRSGRQQASDSLTSSARARLRSGSWPLWRSSPLWA